MVYKLVSCFFKLLHNFLYISGQTCLFLKGEVKILNRRTNTHNRGLLCCFVLTIQARSVYRLTAKDLKPHYQSDCFLTKYHLQPVKQTIYQYLHPVSMIHEHLCTIKYFMNEVCCHFKIYCRLFIPIYLSQLIKLILGFLVLFKSLLPLSVSTQLNSAPSNPGFQQLLGIIYIIHLDKRLSSNSVYQCQPHSSNLFTLQI